MADSNVSYNPLPDGERPRPTRRRSIVLVLSGLLVVGFLVALLSDNGSIAPANVIDNDNNNNNVNDNAKNGLNDVSSSSSKEPERLRPFTSASSAGVSEKSNRRFGARTASYPWTNNMLSWQRTAFHFQPQKNWMNGNYRPHSHLLFLTYSFLICFSSFFLFHLFLNKKFFFLFSKTHISFVNVPAPTLRFQKTRKKRKWLGPLYLFSFGFMTCCAKSCLF